MFSPLCPSPPHGPELMKWLHEADDTDLLLEKFVLEQEEIDM